jgi:DNA-binding MarR family transcriptional regulator
MAARKKPAPRPDSPRGRPALDRDVLDRHLGYFIRRFQVWIFQDFIRSLTSADLRPGQFSVLVVIGANSGLSQAQVAAELGIERARLVRLLDELGRRGLIERTAAANDRRAHALRLTPAGETTLARVKRLAARHEARVEQTLGRRQRKLMLDMLRGFTPPR